MEREAVKRVARAICGHFGESYDSLPESVTYIERKTAERAILDRSEAREIAASAIAEVMAILSEPTAHMLHRLCFVSGGWLSESSDLSLREAFAAALSASPLSQGGQDGT